MVKHLIEAVVNYGEFPAFVEALRNYEKVCSDHGLQNYAAWAGSGPGRMNEVYFEGTFDDAAQLAARDKAHGEIPEVMQALGALIRHLSPGTIIDHQLEGF
jgi:hypothetical protein